MAVRPINVTVTIVESGQPRPAKASEAIVEFAWGSAPWQHLGKYTNSQGIAVWDRKPGETGFGSNWYHVTASWMPNKTKKDDCKILIDDSNNTYEVVPW